DHAGSHGSFRLGETPRLGDLPKRQHIAAINPTAFGPDSQVRQHKTGSMRSLDGSIGRRDNPRRGGLVKKLAALMLLLGSGGIVAAATIRIFTNPSPDDHLKKLFPSAAAFSKLAGDPLHFIAYTVDPRTNAAAAPIGL